MEVTFSTYVEFVGGGEGEIFDIFRFLDSMALDSLWHLEHRLSVDGLPKNPQPLAQGLGPGKKLSSEAIAVG